MNAVVCITTLNEELTIYDLVKSIRERGVAVLVADGGSTDQTCWLAEKAGATVVESSRRIGIGTALAAGLCRAIGSGKFDRYAVMDAGGSHSIFDLPIVLNGNADVVMGSRFLPESIYLGNRKRRVMSQIASAACNSRSSIHCTDWTSGFRSFSPAAAGVIAARQWKADMHGWQIETLNHLLKKGFSSLEVPITYRAGRSSFNRNIALEAFNVWKNM